MSKIDDEMVAGALECWRGVNLGALVQTLDAAGAELVENQKTSLQERRKLAEKTKAFRAVADEHKAAEFRPLLRAYQNEIDALTRRMKHAENSFLRVFQALGSAPDPAVFLASLVDARRAQAEAEARLQAQQAQQTQQQRVAGADEQSDVVRHLRAREDDLQRQLSAANRSLVRLQASFDAQADGHPGGAGSGQRELAARQAELDMALSDLERANARLADAQAQNARLHAQLAAGDAAADDGQARRIGELEAEARRLLEALERAEQQLALADARGGAAVRAAEHAAAAKDDELRRVRAEVARMADYDEIKRDLEIIRSVEFSASGWGMDDEAEAEASGEPLEKLLVRRNKTLESRLTDARNELSRSSADVRRLGERSAELERALQQKAELAARLEADLLRVQAAPAGNDDAGEKPAALHTTAAAAEAGGLMDIVSGQRDRFRQRAVELEDELREQTQAAAEMRRQAEQTKQDNVRLYEEIKYLRSYHGAASSAAATVLPPVTSKFSSSSSSGGSSQGNPGGHGAPASLQIDVDGVAAKYRGMYEESLNPFNAFHRRETTRRVRSMGIVDRLVYMVSSFVVSNRRARMAMLAYAALLHVLVFVALFRSVSLADDGETRQPAGAPLT
ncbi:hypothetical protein GGI15_001330 [Coemansia interrupta]|uniref:Protein CASP n=1 Tax=Coemansia interrupta TaxID=1126814 RepID=A0A9W8HPF8_9FUNG|nr:hypothetical protein GGI15_001330 [Coemansia interrupta]